MPSVDHNVTTPAGVVQKTRNFRAQGSTIDMIKCPQMESFMSIVLFSKYVGLIFSC